MEKKLLKMSSEWENEWIRGKKKWNQNFLFQIKVLNFSCQAIANFGSGQKFANLFLPKIEGFLHWKKKKVGHFWRMEKEKWDDYLN